MDIVIAAAGKGTRMQAHTAAIPKHIIPIAGRPFLYYLLDAALAAGFRRVIVVGGHHFDKLATAITEYEQAESVMVVNQFEKLGEDKYGTACPVLAVKDIVQGDRFVYTMGDHLVSAKDLEQMQKSTSDMLVAVTEHAEPERFGVVEWTDEHTLARIVEKPTQPKTNLVNVGLYTLGRDIFSILEHLPSSPRHEYEMTDAINEVAATQPVRVVQLQDQWLDLGRPEDISALERFLTVSDQHD